MVDTTTKFVPSLAIPRPVDLGGHHHGPEVASVEYIDVVEPKLLQTETYASDTCIVCRSHGAAVRP